MGVLGALSAQSGALLARGVFALSTGLTFPFTKSGIRIVMLAQLGLAAVALGPSRALKLSLQAIMAASAGRTVLVLAQTLPQKLDLDQQAQDKFWDWDPPGELGESGAWKVVRELAQALTKGSDEFPELKDMQTLPLQELGVRLCYKFDDGQHKPDVDEDIEGADDKAVTKEVLDELERFLYFANVIYEAGNDKTLTRLLGDKGFVLNFSKLESDWEAKAPAYVVATNKDTKEFLLSVRGTSQMDDVITDIVAVPDEFDGTGEQAHSGMVQGAEWLFDRFLPLAQGMQDAGYTIKLAGHSLGAGLLALLGLMLRKRGVDRVQGYGFATPPCCTAKLAKQCEGWFQDVTFRSDIVSRFSPQSLGELHGQLRGINWQEESKTRGKENAMLKNAARLATMVNKMASLFGGDDAERELQDSKEREESMEATEKQLGDYQPIKPGKVLYCYRAKPELDAQGDSLGRTMVTGSCPQLRRMHINSYMVQDHTIPCYYMAIDRSNPLEQPEEREKEAVESGEAEDKGCEENKDK